MGWLESQIETRAALDDELLERAYAELAASIQPGHEAPAFHSDDLERADGAVRTILRHCGVNPPPPLESIDGTESDIYQHIDYLCRPSGTMRRNVRLDGDWYAQAFGPYLGKLVTGEPIALLQGGFGGYYYHNPTTGAKVRVNSRTAKDIAPEAVLFYRPLPARALTIRDLLGFILRIFDRSDYLLILAAAIVTTAVGLLPAWANRIAFDTVIPSGQASLVAPIGALLLGVALSSILINASRNLIMSRVSTKLQVITEAATFGRMLALPPSFFKEYASGNLASRMSQVTLLVQQLTSILLGSGLSVLMSTAYIAQVFTLAPMLMIPPLVVALLQAGITVLSTLITIGYQRSSMKASASISGVETALLNGIAKIKLAGAEDRAFAKWAKGYADYARPTYNRPAIVTALPALVSLIGLLGTIAIYYYAGVEHLSVAGYMAFNVAFGQVTAAISMLAGMAGEIAQIGPMLEMVSPILETTPETAEDKPSVGTLNGAIEANGLTFRYEENGAPIVRDLSFKIRPGEYVAFVGKSGCGKSTILRLLLGFETPERGAVYYGPYDVSKVDLRSLRRSIGTVMQDGKLFMGDLYSNITIAAPTATLDDAWEAAEIAGFADDIRRMPMGMQTLMSEGSGGVSGGQRQRIMIARAVCGGKRILMLDEATSALDNITQRHVADALAELKCTRVVVAHRLSTVRHCDRILVVDGGTIAEEGTYEELIARNGFFAELVRNQRLDDEQEASGGEANKA